MALSQPSIVGRDGLTALDAPAEVLVRPLAGGKEHIPGRNPELAARLVDQVVFPDSLLQVHRSLNQWPRSEVTGATLARVWTMHNTRYLHLLGSRNTQKPKTVLHGSHEGAHERNFNCFVVTADNFSGRIV